MQNLQPEFALLSDLAEKIYQEGSYGPERKRAVGLLEAWQGELLTRTTSSPTETERNRALSTALGLAIKIAQEAFVPPWER